MSRIVKILIKISIIIAVFIIVFYVAKNYSNDKGLDLPQEKAANLSSEEVETIRETEKQEVVQEKDKASLIVDYGDNQVDVYNDILINDGDTVFKILEQVSSKNNLELKYKDYGGGMGVFIESINGFTNDFKANRFWQYWVNGEYAKIGASSYGLENGDVVEWKYVEGEL
ncbi:MAG: DUF4430 domain-containing protein [Patescibacteria group bacterium]